MSASRHISGSSHRGAKKPRVPSDLIRLSHRYRGLRTPIPSVRLGDTTSGIPAFCTGKSCTAGACIVGSTAAVLWHRDGTHV